jgi:hypothetical protein
LPHIVYSSHTVCVEHMSYAYDPVHLQFVCGDALLALLCCCCSKIADAEAAVSVVLLSTGVSRKLWKAVSTMQHMLLRSVLHNSEAVADVAPAATEAQQAAAVLQHDESTCAAPFTQRDDPTGAAPYTVAAVAAVATTPCCPLAGMARPKG